MAEPFEMQFCCFSSQLLKVRQNNQALQFFLVGPCGRMALWQRPASLDLPATSQVLAESTALTLRHAQSVHPLENRPTQVLGAAQLATIAILPSVAAGLSQPWNPDFHLKDCSAGH